MMFNKFFDTKYRIEECAGVFTAQYRPWYAPEYINCFDPQANTDMAGAKRDVLDHKEMYKPKVKKFHYV